MITQIHLCVVRTFNASQGLPLPVLFHRVWASLREVGTSGLEPPTSRLSGVRSNHLSYAPIFGGDEENRTPDPLLAKQVLSQLSYTPRSFSFKMLSASSKPNNTSRAKLNSSDLRVENFLLGWLSPCPLYSLERR